MQASSVPCALVSSPFVWPYSFSVARSLWKHFAHEKITSVRPRAALTPDHRRVTCDSANKRMRCWWGFKSNANCKSVPVSSSQKNKLSSCLIHGSAYSAVPGQSSSCRLLKADSQKGQHFLRETAGHGPPTERLPQLPSSSHTSSLPPSLWQVSPHH